MNNFEKNVIQIWGNKGRDWLKILPTIVGALAAAMEID